MEEIQAYRSAVDEELRSLPESFSDNPQGKLLNLFAEFCACIKECTTGSDSQPEFFEGLYEEFGKLANDITRTRPNFEILPKPQKQSLANAFAYVDDDSISAPVSSHSSPREATPESLSRSESEGRDESGHSLHLQRIKL